MNDTTHVLSMPVFNHDEDLFDLHELQPAYLRAALAPLYALVDEFEFTVLSEVLEACKSVGYTFDYGLDGTAYGLRPEYSYGSFCPLLVNY